MEDLKKPSKVRPFCVSVFFKFDRGSGWCLPGISISNGNPKEAELVLPGFVEEKKPWLNVVEGKSLERFGEDLGLIAKEHKFYQLHGSGLMSQTYSQVSQFPGGILRGFCLVTKTQGSFKVSEEKPVASNDGLSRVVRMWKIHEFNEHVLAGDHRSAFKRAVGEMCRLDKIFRSANEALLFESV